MTALDKSTLLADANQRLHLDYDPVCGPKIIQSWHKITGKVLRHPIFPRQNPNVWTVVDGAIPLPLPITPCDTRRLSGEIFPCDCGRVIWDDHDPRYQIVVCPHDCMARHWEPAGCKLSILFDERCPQCVNATARCKWKLAYNIEERKRIQRYLILTNS